MPKLSTATNAGAAPEALLDVICDVARFGEFVPGVRAAKVEKQTDAGDETTLDCAVQIAVRYFSGWVTAKVISNRALRTVKIEMVKGPFQLARAELALNPAATAGRTDAVLDVEYATPVAIYKSLIEKHKDSGFEQVMAVFSRRSFESGKGAR